MGLEKKIHIHPPEDTEAEGGRMVKERDFEAEKIQIIRKKIRYPTLFLCFMTIFLLEMGQNQQLPLK